MTGAERDCCANTREPVVIGQNRSSGHCHAQRSGRTGVYKSLHNFRNVVGLN